jgi:hypothetical protein
MLNSSYEPMWRRASGFLHLEPCATLSTQNEIVQNSYEAPRRMTRGDRIAVVYPNVGPDT